MVEGTVYLSDGQTVTLYAGDMLTALKIATGTYHGLAIKMDFKTVENCERMKEHGDQKSG